MIFQASIFTKIKHKSMQVMNTSKTSYWGSPSITPKVIAIALPPCQWRNGEKAWPSTAATATIITETTESPKTVWDSRTKGTPLATSRTTASRPSFILPARKTLAEPGLPSPYLVMSFLSHSRPIITEKGIAPRIKAAMDSDAVYTASILTSLTEGDTSNVL